LCLIGITLIAAVLRFLRLDYAPSGGHGDVSWIGINAIDWVDRGVIPFYIRELYSPEFFPVYASGILTQLIGVSYLPQRIFTAGMGVLFVVLLYPMTYWLIGTDRSVFFRQRAGLFASLTGALSLHVVGMNRLGMESPPFLTSVALFTWLTAWAWHRTDEPGSMARWTVAGASLALNQYVYLPARLMPVVAALWMGYLLITHYSRFRASLRGWFTMAFVSLILTLPALVLFLYAPEAFSGRADSGGATTGGWIWLYDTSAYGGIFGLMLQKFLLTLKGILWSWQGAYSFMGLPIFSPVFALGFVIALLMAVRSLRQTVFAWTLLAIPVLLITELISGAVLEIHALHQMGIIPFICVLAGLGLARLWEKLRFQQARGLEWGLRGALLIGLFTPTVVSMSYYLQTFIPSEYSDSQWSWRKAQTDVDLGRYVSLHNDQAFLLPYSEYIRPDVAWTLAAGFRERTSAINAEGMLNIPNPPSALTVIHMSDPARPRHDGYPARPDDRLWVLLHDNTVYLLPPLTDDQVNAVLGSGESTPLIDASGTQIAEFVTFHAPDGLFMARQVIDHRVDAVFDGRVRLLGYTTPFDELRPGMSMHVTLYWQALEPLPVDYEVFAQLWTDSAQAISTSHVYPFSGMYRSRLWRSDEIIATHHYLEVPQDAAPGRYTLIGGMFRYLLNQNVALDGDNADTQLHIAWLRTFRLPRLLDSVEASLISPIVFGDQIQIAGLEISQNGLPLNSEPILRGSGLDIQIIWEALAAMPTDYSVFVHLIRDTSAPPTAQLDAVIGGNYPTGIWLSSERLTAAYNFPIPADLEPGTYQLVIGVYDWASGMRLTTSSDETIMPLIEALEVIQ
jgi:hypothetical protein